MIRTAALFALMSCAACEAQHDGLAMNIDIVGDAIPTPLTDTPGEAQRGKAIFSERDAGHCVLCHTIPSLDVPFQGNVGPDLSMVGSRLSEGQIRLRIVDASQLNPETVMPPYYRTTSLHQVATQYQEAPVLPAQDIEDIIAYLVEQKGEQIDG